MTISSHCSLSAQLAPLMDVYTRRSCVVTVLSDAHVLLLFCLLDGVSIESSPIGFVRWRPTFSRRPSGGCLELILLKNPLLMCYLLFDIIVVKFLKEFRIVSSHLLLELFVVSVSNLAVLCELLFSDVSTLDLLTFAHPSHFLFIFVTFPSHHLNVLVAHRM